MELFPKPPSDLKISQPEFPNPLDMAKELAKSLPEGNKSVGGKSPSIKIVETLPADYLKKTLAIVINIWRIKSRLTDSHSKAIKEELAKEDVKKIARYLESIHDSFTQLGIEIIDRTGETFDYGLPEKVVTAKPQEGISKELVIETLRPTVKWNNQIFPGEVEIATPITKSDKGES
jgi:hypothetical protein